MIGDRDPALDQLGVLVGDWDTESTHRMIAGVVRGKSSFEWLAGRRFLIYRSDMPAAEIPSGISIIGGGETPGTWPMHYFDSRGVMRVYQVTFEGGALKVSRDHPGFSQRFTGTSLHLAHRRDEALFALPSGEADPRVLCARPQDRQASRLLSSVPGGVSARPLPPQQGEVRHAGYRPDEAAHVSVARILTL